jgi:hypothetical protein
VTDLVDIQLVDDSAKTPDAQQIRGWVAAVFTTLERSPLALTVRVVGEEEMAKLNRPTYCRFQLSLCQVCAQTCSETLLFVVQW